MYPSLSSAKLLPLPSPSNTEQEMPPLLVELTKKEHFRRFLEKEMNTAKTEAEKEAVRAVLLKTRIEIRAMEREWKRIQAQEQSNSPDAKRVAAPLRAARVQ